MVSIKKQQAKAAIKQWCRDNGIKADRVDHIHPRAYVVGYAAAQCLIVSFPWQDSEPHLREIDRKNPLHIVYRFDKTLKAGDWCCTGYVINAVSGESVAVRIEA